jgi:hypothetical protein
MNLEEAKTLLNEAESYKSWEKEDHYLCHIFFTSDKMQIFQFGYYSPKKDLITTFLVSEAETVKEGESKAFKQPDAIIEELDLDQVKVHIVDAFDVAEEIRKAKHPSFGVLKKMVVIQCMKEPIFNITLITNAFETLNIKINAITKEVISDKIVKIAEFSK